MPSFQDLIDEWVKEFEKFEAETGWNELKLYGTSKLDKFSGGQISFSEKMYAVLHQLEKKATITPSIKKLKEFVQVDINMNLPRQLRQGQDEGKHEHLLPEVLEIEKDIFCKVSTAHTAVLKTLHTFTT